VGVQIVALLVGTVLVLGGREARQWWQTRATRSNPVDAGDSTAATPMAAEHGELVDPAAEAAAPATEPDWQRLLIALRPVRERGWEGPVGQPAEESWPMVLLMILLGIALGFASVASPWRFATFVLYLVLGLGAALTALGFADWQAGTFLPPGNRGAILRATASCLTCSVLLLWIPRTTYRGLSAESMRDALQQVSVTKWPRTLADQFHGPGIALAVTLAFAVTILVSLLLFIVVEMTSLRAMIKVGAGGRRPSTLWWAQFYRDRQPPLWGRYIVLTAVGFALASGALLRLWDSTLGKP
jgi:hypothetical protein